MADSHSGHKRNVRRPRPSSSHDRRGRSDEDCLISYVAAGGGHVHISFPLDPYRVLGVPSTASRGNIKQAFRNKINQSSRQNRALVSIANHILTSTADRYQRNCSNNLSYSIRELDHFMLAGAGDTKALASKIKNGENILDDMDEHGRTLLYLACKSGFYDTSKLLLTKGAAVNKTQRDGSTALHVAAYYGHGLVVGLLLEHGAATNIKNGFGSTALEESPTIEVKSLIQAASTDSILSLAAKLKEKGLVKSVRFVKYREKIIAKELVRDPTSLDASTRAQWNNIIRTWEPVWHGTRYKHLQPILEKGLLPSGSKGIKPSAGHYALNEEHFGITNWAAAIFVSPSIMYASHPVYSERVLSESSQWCVLVKALCKPKSYKSYDPTVYRYDPMDGEPDTPEYRVPVEGEDKNVVLRVESTRSVVVRSLIFLRVNFLENEEIDFKEALKIFA